MIIDIKNHEILLALLQGIDDILDEALERDLSRSEAIDMLRRMKLVTKTVSLMDDRLADT